MQFYTLAFMAMAESASAAVIPNVHHDGLRELFAENIQARLWRTALTQAPSLDDEHGWPQYTEGAHNNTPNLDEAVEHGTYVKFSASSWTAGFFPDSLWQIYNREKNLLHFHESLQGQPPLEEWLQVAQQWTDPLIANSNLTDTHDLGFLAKPFESALTYNDETKWLPVLANMSNNLAARYVPEAGVIRSWDTNNSTYTQRGSHEDSVLVIIDNMMNLALLARSAAKYTGNQTHLDVARSHADKTRDHHVRPDGSSYHVCDYSATTGELYLCRTAQGLADNSTWARGQAWGIYGFAEAYSSLEDQSYLETSIKMAEWFPNRLPQDGVPFWDFDAPFIPNVTPRDSSAATIAASGMLLLQEQIEKHPQAVSQGRNYRHAAVKLLKDTVALSLAGEITFVDINKEDPAASLGASTDVSTPANTAESKGFEAILLHATANNNPQAGDGRNYDSGLVYGDFYLIEAGNRLMARQGKHGNEHEHRASH
ncbi:Unsaturated glucuronyl hydrolase [Pseudocercospora fuligena]|uniref:Unsaturated glucuronyl hydrolase n=1 Tax=Pseudocercospora fuligena TaxID=685502 RepID=A0A8H6VGZ9_9PEZI|nr:Unsaturated glucuronyl hydrolase [Pseudocercospora fuligena]